MKVTLQPLTALELPQVYVWRTDSEVSRYMLTSGPMSYLEHLNWFNKASVDPSEELYTINVGETPVGFARLYDINKFSCKLGIYIGDKASRGKGFASKAMTLLIQRAFEDLGISKLIAEVLAFNDAAIMLYRKHGFETVDANKGTIYMVLENWEEQT